MRISLALVMLGALVVVEACSAPSARWQPSASHGATGELTTKLAYQESGQVELTTPDGEAIYIDVWNSRLISKAPSANDVLLLTHSEREDLGFQDSFPGPKLITEAGEKKLGDLSVVSVAGSHTDEPAVPGEPASNYIVVFEVGGLRIADLGENGEEALSAAQLAALGRVDVAICPLTNTGGNDETGQKAINVIDQLQPRLVVASFTDLDTAKLAATKWAVAYSDKPLALRASQLPPQTTVVFLGEMAENYATILNARKLES